MEIGKTKRIVESDPVQDPVPDREPTKLPLPAPQPQPSPTPEPERAAEYPLCPECGDPIDYCQGHGANLSEAESEYYFEKWPEEHPVGQALRKMGFE